MWLQDKIESLADLSHDQWVGWMKYLFSKSEKMPDGTVVIPASLVERWNRQVSLAYTHLTEKEKESDRKEARRMLERAGFSLAQLQEELAPWQFHNFGDRPSWMPLLGAQEEIGELSHAHLKQAQGIRGTKEEHQAAKKDAICDAIVFLCDYANAEGFDVEEALAATWAEVKQRDFKRFPLNGRTE
jgi:NTP pyrophosphatase (non-canonical NTP hydrolase)